MAHPADIAPKGSAAFAGGRLFSPEEADRLAATFRPSWELDDAPFTGAGTLSETDLRALQGGGTHADVRAVAHASNGAHAPPAPTQSHEPENSVIIDRTITADAAPAPKAVAAAKPAGATMLGMAPPIVPQPVLQVAPQVAPQPASQPPPPAPAPQQLQRPPTPMSQRPAAPAFNVSPPGVKARAKPVSIDLEEAYPKKSKTGLWVGLGLGGMAAMGLVVWLVGSSGSSEKAAAPAPTATKAADDKLSAVPPPPPPTTAAAAATTADTPPPATVAAAPPPTPTATPIPTTPVTALPQAAPTHAAPVFQPRPTYGGAAPAARPAGKPKGQTIVRDVPF